MRPNLFYRLAKSARFVCKMFHSRSGMRFSYGNSNLLRSFPKLSLSIAIGAWRFVFSRYWREIIWRVLHLKREEGRSHLLKEICQDVFETFLVLLCHFNDSLFCGSSSIGIICVFSADTQVECHSFVARLDSLFAASMSHFLSSLLRISSSFIMAL
jgi:hypothetical protein